MEFVLIPSGSFMMGCDSSLEECHDNEIPRHEVSISQAFYLGKFPVTQAQWLAVMENNPSKFEGRRNPVEQISWHDAQEFVGRLNAKEGHNRYRLPTEAEWEYAARAGTDMAYFFGSDRNELSRYAWYAGNSGEKTQPVGRKLPNPWGLYDVYGNVFEWVLDWYGKKYYANRPGTDLKGPSYGANRVLRGGSWYSDAGICRSAYRSYFTPDYRFVTMGVRLALSLDQ
ncbi:MAG: formylglycine-generating enzyme family protein [Desulfovibrionaceae bacterium]|nr:formylglycine-generating enzyme family protein [Desulfovibrionaceae bacterium]